MAPPENLWRLKKSAALAIMNDLQAATVLRPKSRESGIPHTGVEAYGWRTRNGSCNWLPARV
ncbi:MAG: hypothetical protein DMG40_03390 [Acidobacteria bacterium]|nr:MAG: hypothetical protein DMG40_03390 [Acidobacteriota bacterium]